MRKDGIIPWGDGPFAYHDEIEVRIEDLTNMGDGVAKVTPVQFVLLVQKLANGSAARLDSGAVTIGARTEQTSKLLTA